MMLLGFLFTSTIMWQWALFSLSFQQYTQNVTTTWCLFSFWSKTHTASTSVLEKMIQTTHLMLLSFKSWGNKAAAVAIYLYNACNVWHWHNWHRNCFCQERNLIDTSRKYITGMRGKLSLSIVICSVNTRKQSASGRLSGFFALSSILPFLI